MYAGVPSDVPSCVSHRPRRPGPPGACVRDAWSALAIPKVGDHGRAPGEQHVLRLDVPVHEVLPVRVVERHRDVPQDRRRLRERHRALCQPRAQ
jgi:hypothetical protein